jgi:hypothetical protein
MDSDDEICVKKKPSNAKKVFADSDDSDKEGNPGIEESKLEDSNDEEPEPLEKSSNTRISNYKSLLDSDDDSVQEPVKLVEVPVENPPPTQPIPSYKNLLDSDSEDEKKDDGSLGDSESDGQNHKESTKIKKSKLKKPGKKSKEKPGSNQEESSGSDSGGRYSEGEVDLANIITSKRERPKVRFHHFSIEFEI